MWSSSFEQLPVWANVLIVAGTILVIAKGASWLVASAAQLANRLGISELVIGLTVVALGTSAPEFAVTLIAALNRRGNISVGNIVGSNIFNLGFILGGAAVVRPIPTGPTLLRRDGVVLLVASVVLLATIGTDLHLHRHDGFVLAAMLAGYLALLYRQRRPPPGADQETEELLAGAPRRSLPALWALVVVGLASITLGSKVLVESASAVARHFGISEWVIGVTIVAAGTSAPELATTLAGVLTHRFDISAGNLVGSDIFNMLGVLGVAGLVRPVTVGPIARWSLVGMIAMNSAVLGFMRTGWRVSRPEGAILLLVAIARWALDVTLRVG